MHEASRSTPTSRQPGDAVLVGLLAGYYATYSCCWLRGTKTEALPRPINIFDIKKRTGASPAT